MKLKAFVGMTLSASVVLLACPAAGQEDPAEPPAPAAPGQTPPTSPETSPEAPVARPPDGASGDGNGANPAPPSAEPPPSAAPEVDRGPTKIGEKLSPLIVTAGFGYAYVAVTHPDLVSHNLSGPFLEIAVGTELDRQFRLSLAFTSFETKIRRTHSGQWEEGAYTPKVASALTSTSPMDPVEPTEPQSGGVTVQRTFHAHSIGPRMDFLPMGSQGPYLGMTTALGIIQDVETRVGVDLGARIGGEWRPFQALSLAVEAGAHGQIYADASAAIPYATARLNFLLDANSLKSSSRSPAPTAPLMPRTLPPNPPR